VPMVRSRTIKTLAALVAAMTVGTAVLILMETAPARPTSPLSLRAVENRPAPVAAVIRATEVPLQVLKWRNVVIHDDGRDGQGILEGGHFLIGCPGRLGDGVVRPTRRWVRQEDGRHVYLPGFSYNENSVGIVLLRRPGQRRATPRQMAALVALVRSLQRVCRISRDHVYLHSELGGEGCPAPEMHLERLRGRLLPSVR